MNEKVLFFSLFMKKPKEIGSVIPSSNFLVKEILKNIDFKSSKYIVEYGSGTGCITKEILKRARSDAKILCFETNKNLYNHLKRSLKDKRLIIVNDGAENIARYMGKYKIPEADYVIAVLSFFTLGKEKKHAIMKETKKALSDNGKFIFCRYVPNFERKLSNYFSNSSMKFVPFNIPPSLLYVCGK